MVATGHARRPSHPAVDDRIPIVVAIGIVAGIDYGRVADLQSSLLVWAAVGTLMVGFCEEMVYRGLAVVGFRGGYPEVRVWLFSSLLFMLLHAWDLVAGQSLAATGQQLVFTFLLGSVLYACRRSSGGLVVPILLHAAWDWTSFTSTSDAFVDGVRRVRPAVQPGVPGPRHRGRPVLRRGEEGALPPG